MDTEELRRQFKPATVRVLLVGESPPKEGTFFYDRSLMTTYTKSVFESALSLSFESNNEFFEFMKQSGFYLEDLSQTPVNTLAPRERKVTLIKESEKFAKRVAVMKPEAIVICLKSIETIVRQTLNRANTPARIYSLPFPGNGHQSKYKAQLIPIVKKYIKSSRNERISCKKVSINKKMNDLFEDWSEDNCLDRKGFKYDGAIDESSYLNSRIKTLFICKEPNDPERVGGDYRIEWKRKENLKYSFVRKIALWSHGINTRFKEYPEKSRPTEEELIQSLQKVAFINIKKTGGKRSSDYKKIRETVNTDRSFLKRQIEILAPRVVIGGFRDEYIWRTLFEGAELKESIYGIKTGKSNKMTLVDFFHPSARGPKYGTYSLLKELWTQQQLHSL